jgi:putative sigma-54 modulation protein
MQVLVTFRHMDATPALRRYAETKVRRIHKVMKHPIEAHVILEVSKRRHIAEITLGGEHLHVTAKEATADLYSAIDLAMDKVERQVQKHLTKRLAARHATPPAVEEAPPRRRAARPAVVSERVPIVAMSVSDAVRMLSRDTRDFLFFQNELSDSLNVLFRRKDGSYGLLEPEVG